MTRFAAVISALALTMIAFSGTAIARGKTCFEKPQFDKPQFDKPERATISFERNLMIQPVIEPQFYDEPVRLKAARYRFPRERSMIEKPVFDTQCPPAPKRIRSDVSTETIAKSTLQAQKRMPKTLSQPKAAVVIADCNCGPQKSAPTVIR